MAKIKRYIGKHSSPRLEPSRMVLRIGREELVDSWKGSDFGLTDGTTITLATTTTTTTPTPTTTTAATAVPSSPAASLSLSGDPGSPVMKRVEARLALRRAFHAAASGGSQAENTALRHAIAADKEAAAHVSATPGVLAVLNVSN